MATAILTKTPSAGLLADLQGARRAVMPLRGEIGAAEVERLVERALSLAAAGRTCLVLDLQRVTHWDYRHLPALWRLAQRLRAQGGDLRLAAPSCYLSRILQFAGLLELLATHEDAAKASRSYGRASRGGRA
jgi:anti-sigma B factor antagonist